MAQDLTIIGGGTAVVPEHIAKRFAGRETNVMETSIASPSLTFAGKVWSINIGSEKIKLISRNDDGDEHPVSTIPLVIIDYAKQRGRTYYEGAYDPDSVSPPRCASPDGIAPDTEDPISAKCAGCPMAAKGSRINELNKAVSACTEHRLLVVVPAKGIEKYPPLRLKLAITSDYDGQSKELQDKGMFAFSNYLSFLKTRSIAFTDAISTKVSFDPNVAYPKLLFRADKWLDEGQLDAIEKIKEDRKGDIDAILGATALMPPGGRAVRSLPAPKADTPVATAEAPKADTPKPETAAARKKREKAEADAAAAAEAEAQAAKATEQSTAEIVEDEEDEDDKAIRLAQERKAAKAAAATKAAAPATAAAPKADAPKQTERKVTEATPAPGGVSEDVAAMLGDWSD